MKKPVAPKKPKNAYGVYLKHTLAKKFRSIKNKPIRKVKGYIGNLHYKQHTPTKYAKNYWKNFTQPIRRPYLKVKKTYNRTKKIVGAFTKALKLHQQQIINKEKYNKRLERYERQLGRYNKWRDNQFKKLDKRKADAEKEAKKRFKNITKKDNPNNDSRKEIVSDFKKNVVAPPKGTPLSLVEEWKLEKQREMFLKWTKAQLNYVPRMTENDYLAILVSPETIYKYYTKDAQSMFSTVEEFRDFLGDYFGYGSLISFGVTSRIFDKDGNVTGVIRFFKILLKLVAKVV